MGRSVGDQCVALGSEQRDEAARHVVRRSTLRADQHRLDGQAWFERPQHDRQMRERACRNRIDDGKPETFRHKTAAGRRVLSHERKARRDPGSCQKTLEFALKSARRPRYQCLAGKILDRDHRPARQRMMPGERADGIDR
ncbi:hypothetical protein MBRA_00941 [Methylobacterium brachiatum]|nr:hypothetical protein MBRA_00941 [Methylobacterium brachiatum]